jgi:hypothetical protein
LENYELSEPTPEDYERDDIYRLTNEVYAQIQQMEFNLQHLANENKRQEAGSASGSTLGRITEVLNVHHDNLHSLDRRTKSLAMNIENMRSSINSTVLSPL